MSEIGDFDELHNLYQQVILDRGRRPRHAVRLEVFDTTAKGDNPLCGDRIQVWVKLENGAIDGVGFEARGCAISIASADLMADTLQGRTCTDAQTLFDAFREMMRTGKYPACDDNYLGALRRLAPLRGVHEYPSRLRCATLPWFAVISALTGRQGESR